ncbi:hypothetical protein ZIOFF_068726 [Zingiber officinale]|uniref:Uncharacterized protein n=1 Tax=Zingiber officinale TaxID=94328 RepID=A0A8J5EEU5_ZINOF|nr:hypothetical protein ZIOFF_068726 [Zingiber officinale]
MVGACKNVTRTAFEPNARHRPPVPLIGACAPGLSSTWLVLGKMSTRTAPLNQMPGAGRPRCHRHAPAGLSPHGWCLAKCHPNALSNASTGPPRGRFIGACAHGLSSAWLVLGKMSTRTPFEPNAWHRAPCRSIGACARRLSSAWLVLGKMSPNAL